MKDCILIALIACCLMIAGCNTNGSAVSDPAEPAEEKTEESFEATGRIYTENTVRLHELNNYSYILPRGEMTQDESCIYVFEESVTTEVREQFIEWQKLLLDKLDIRDPMTIFLSDSYMDRGDSENYAIFCTTPSMHTWRQVMITIQAAEGADINYGYAYAKANSIAADLDWETDPIQGVSDEELMSLLSSDSARLDLILPCFTELYSSELQIRSAKTLAGIVYNSAGAQDEDAFLSAIKEYAEAHDIPYSETYLRFACGGTAVPLIIRTKYVEEWITDEFHTDSSYLLSGLSIPDGSNWQKSISEMIRTRELYDREIGDACKALGYSDPDRKLVVWSQWGDKTQYRGYTDYQKDEITVNSVFAICQVYIHHIYRNLIGNYRNKVDWCAEALAMYYSREVEYDEAMMYCKAEGKEPVSFEEYTEETRAFITEKMSSMQKSPGEVLLTMDDDGKVYFGSYYMIADYLAGLYGEESFTRMMTDPVETETLVGKDLDQLIDDWNAYMTGRFLR